MIQCAQDPEILERYVANLLSEEDRSAFEVHFFECADCLSRLQDLQIIQQQLAATGSAGRRLSRRSRAGWLAAAAAIVAAVVIWQVRAVEHRVRGSAPDATAGMARPAAERPATIAPEPARRATIAGRREALLAEMATVTPPQYIPLATRSDASDDARTFEAAMKRYAAGDYGAAARQLEPLARRSTDLPHAAFFLGISELMEGHRERARSILERTVASGAAPYADEAHFYLAKIALSERDTDVAARELRIAAREHAGPPGEAAALLRSVESLQR
jgi:TolA-binding protein